MTIFSKFSPSANLFANRCQIINVLSKRDGHARRFIMRGGKSTPWRVADHIHFYSCIGFGFWGAIVLYMNTVYGRCVLTEIPDGYEPRFWEYESRPITQVMQRYFFTNPQKQQEKMLAMFDEEIQKREWRFAEERVHHLIFERGDYKAWYYVPYKAKWMEYTAYEHSKYRDNLDPLKEPRYYQNIALP